MADEDRTPAGAEAPGDEERDEHSTPFDHPAFLPGLLFAGTLWFGYDGWFNEEIESVRFNRFGAFILLGCAIYFTIDTIRPVRFLGAAFYAAGAIWLAWIGWLGEEGGLFALNDSVILTSRYGAGVMLALCLYSLVRGLLRGRKQSR